MANTLTNLIPIVISEMQSVLRTTGALFNATNQSINAEAVGLGQVINLPKTVALSAYDITPAAVPPALTDIAPTTDTLTLDQQKGARFHLTGEEERAIASAEDYRGKQIAEAIKAVVNAANVFLLDTMGDGAGTQRGTAGVNPFASNPDVVMDCWKDLADNEAPNDDNLYMILGTSEWAALGKLDQFQKLNEAPTGTDFSRAQVGMLANFKTYYDQKIVAGTGYGTGRNNIYCHSSATRFAFRPSAEPMGGDMAVDSAIVSDPVTGLSLRLAMYKGYHANQFEVSAVYGATVDRSELVGVLQG